MLESQQYKYNDTCRPLDQLLRTKGAKLKISLNKAWYFYILLPTGNDTNISKLLLVARVVYLPLPVLLDISLSARPWLLQLNVTLSSSTLSFSKCLCSPSCPGWHECAPERTVHPTLQENRGFLGAGGEQTLVFAVTVFQITCPLWTGEEII